CIGTSRKKCDYSDKLLAEIKEAWSMVQSAWSIKTEIRDRSLPSSASSSAASNCTLHNLTKT
ncbi:MAG TPA: hypothetical protein VGA09_12335, partial [Candidatus Binatia bacterium]